MTIAEIESTLKTLENRHQDLNEETLTTLLTAGGWEEKVIKEAVILFNSHKKTAPSLNVSKTTESIQNTTSQDKVGIPEVTTAHTENVLFTVPEPKQEILNTQPKESSQTVLPEQKNIATTQTVPTSPVVTVENKITETETKKPEENLSFVYIDGTGREEGELAVFQENSKDENMLKIQETEKLSVGELPNVLANEFVLETKEEALAHKKNNQGLPSVTEYLNSKEAELRGVKEPESLILPETNQNKVSRENIVPENLPMRPFDSTSHVWPFSRYKEVFHGDTMQQQMETQETPVVKHEEAEHHDHTIKKIKIKRTGFDGEDEGLIFLTGVALLIILLLLSYMYANGRL